jgi:aryl-alcohol dehydrogenase-like predicted oxidoreductase
VNRLALGTVQFGVPYGIANRGGQVARSEAKEMLKLAAIKSIDTLDTGIAYGDSEACLGELGARDFKIVTKLPAVPNHCEDVSAWVTQQLNASLARLNVTSVYGFLLHRPAQLLGENGAELYRALQVLKDSDKVQKLGVSIYSPSELDVLIPQFHFDLVQAPFNLVDQRLYRSGWMRRLKDYGVEVHARSVFLQGLLLMAQADIPEKFSPWNELWKSWHKWLAARDTSTVEACLAFPLSYREIDRVVVGADNVKQLNQIINAASAIVINDLPDLECEDEALINPAHWAKL